MRVGPLQNQGAQVDGFSQQSSFLEFFFLGASGSTLKQCSPTKNDGLTYFPWGFQYTVGLTLKHRTLNCGKRTRRFQW